MAERSLERCVRQRPRPKRCQTNRTASVIVEYAITTGDLGEPYPLQHRETTPTPDWQDVAMGANDGSNGDTDQPQATNN
eukprot:12902881-Prorocentrum_lima.AAC.1